MIDMDGYRLDIAIKFDATKTVNSKKGITKERVILESRVETSCSPEACIRTVWGPCCIICRENYAIETWGGNCRSQREACREGKPRGGRC